jgi:hypothetical protein
MKRAWIAAAVAAVVWHVVMSAQQTGSIAGVVKDSTGAVLPGVTVETSSPALIEKVRVTTTDSVGAYRIADLPPGVYATTFSLGGFSTVKREGIELTAGFAANVNADLRVGEVAETLTVSGASPVVDVQNVLQQRVATRDVLDSVPTGKQYTGFATLIPGLSPSGPGGAGGSVDVGGSSGMNFDSMQIHGGREGDSAIRVNSLSVASITSPANSRSNLQDGMVEEYQMQYAAQPAEIPYGGVYMNVIPKSGGNMYSGALFLGGSAEALQSDNLGELKAQGLTVAGKVKRIFDINPSFGGPIARDRLWFYGAFRQFISDAYVPGLYTNQDVGAWVYRPTTTRAVSEVHDKNASLNLTFQATPRNKFTFFYNYDFECFCQNQISALLSAEASWRETARNPLYQGTWASPVTNHLLIEAAASRYISDFPRNIQPPDAPQGGAIYPSILEQSNNMRFRSTTSNPVNNGIIDHYRASASYVTAAHAIKVGLDVEHQWADNSDKNIGNVAYRTLNGIPNQATYYTLPYAWNLTMIPWSIYARDQWTMRKVTLNLGLRYDNFQSSNAASHIPATQYLPVARDFAGFDVLNWHDLDPRLGVSWDVFGTGKTAIKATLSRFIQQENEANTQALNPVIAATNSVARTWTPTAAEIARIRAGDPTVAPIGDPLNPAANGELGPSPDNNFGKPTTTLRYDPNWASGYGVRPFNWETTVGLQQELMPRVSMSAMYYRRIYGNFIVTQNTLVTPADFDPYCITAPVDPRLPGGGGNQICGLYDLNPSKVGQVNQLRTDSGTFGNQYDHWNGFDLTFHARLPDGLLLQGGWSVGKKMTDNCQIVVKIGNSAGTSTGSPAALGNPSTYNCHQETPFLPQTKFLWSYPLPWWAVQLSGSFQRALYDPTGSINASASVTGMSALYVASNAVIAPSLGRNLSSAPSATIDLITHNPGLYFDSMTQFDFRVAKTFVVGRTKVQPQFDMYNLFNDNTPLNFNLAYGTNGASWATPLAALPGRLLRFGVQMHF